jgi:hypothetical protein
LSLVMQTAATSAGLDSGVSIRWCGSGGQARQGEGTEERWGLVPGTRLPSVPGQCLSLNQAYTTPGYISFGASKVLETTSVPWL